MMGLIIGKFDNISHAQSLIRTLWTCLKHLLIHIFDDTHQNGFTRYDPLVLSRGFNLHIASCTCLTYPCHRPQLRPLIQKYFFLSNAQKEKKKK